MGIISKIKIKNILYDLKDSMSLHKYAETYTEAEKAIIKQNIDIKDGEPGYTPVRGTDYWTEADKAEIKSYVDEAILGGSW